MKEQRLVCDRCGATATWDDDLVDWESLNSDNDEIRVFEDYLERIDLCPGCVLEFQRFILEGRGELSESAEMYLEGMSQLQKDE